MKGKVILTCFLLNILEKYFSQLLYAHLNLLMQNANLVKYLADSDKRPSTTVSTKKRIR